MTKRMLPSHFKNMAKLGAQKALHLILIATIGALGLSLSADTWRMPESETYRSSNRQFRLRITPAPIQSQLAFWEGEAAGKGHPGQRREAPKVSAMATIYFKQWWGYRKISEFPLRNRVAPVSALISNDGNRIVTFNDWHMVGYGPNVVVIYDRQGQLIRNLTLRDFLSAGDIEALPTTASSLWWGHGHELRDTEDRLELLIRPDRWSNDGQDRIFRVPVNLSTGTVLEPIRDRLSPGSLTMANVKAATAEEEEQQLTTDDGWFFNPGSGHLKPTEGPHLPSLTAFEFGSPFESVAYPPIARAARVTGRVVIDLWVSETGNVLGQRAISGPPLLRKASMEAAKGWKFRGPFLGSRSQFTRLVLEYGFTPHSATKETTD